MESGGNQLEKVYSEEEEDEANARGEEKREEESRRGIEAIEE